LLTKFDLSRLNYFGIFDRIGLSYEFMSSFSLWSILFYTVPGVSVLRAPGRFYQFLMLPAGIAVAMYLFNKIQINKKKIVCCILLLTILTTFIFIEHQNMHTMTEWTKTWMNDYLENISPPPDDLESFFLVNNAHTINFIVQLDAMSIANMFEINTINGYSGQFPEDWHYYYFNTETAGNYTDISIWVNRYQLKNVYLYDYLNDLWIPYTEEALIDLETQFINTRLHQD